jgi:hypothetical protein
MGSGASSLALVDLARVDGQETENSKPKNCKNTDGPGLRGDSATPDDVLTDLQCDVILSRLEKELDASLEALSSEIPGGISRDVAVRSLLRRGVRPASSSELVHQQSCASSRSRNVSPSNIRQSLSCEQGVELVEQVSDKAILIMNDDKLSRQQLEARPKGAHPSGKVVEVLGSTRMADNKVRQRLGDEMSMGQKRDQRASEDREIQQEEKERGIAIERVLSQPAPDTGKHLERQVNEKALQVIGDKNLQEQQLKALPKGAKADIKAATILGEMQVLGEGKLAKNLGGGMTAEQHAEMKKHDRKEATDRAEKERREHESHISSVLKMKADTSIGNIGGKKGSGGGGPMSPKAPRILGSVELEKKALMMVPDEARGNKKATQMMGDAALASKKAAAMLAEDC